MKTLDEKLIGCAKDIEDVADNINSYNSTLAEINKDLQDTINTAKRLNEVLDELLATLQSR